MPHVTVNGTSLYYESVGDGPEAVVFAHGGLLSGRMFDGVTPALRDRYRCVTFDFRGQGQSALARTGYDMDTLADDTATLLRELGCGPCHFVGCSMGGFVGMRLAVERPELLRSLTLIGTSASPEPHKLQFRTLGWMASLFGCRVVTRWVMPVQFGPAFLKDSARAEVRNLWRERIASNSRRGSVRAAGGVIDRPYYSGQLSRIRTPTLIVVGDDDRATPPAESAELHAAIPGSRLVVVPEAGHAVPIEDPAEVTAAVSRFLDEQG